MIKRLDNELSEKLLYYLKVLNYNRIFNNFFNILSVVSVVYILILTFFGFFELYKINMLIYFFIDIFFLILFSFELIVRYLVIGDLKKFWKVYFWDIVSLIGFIPIDFIIFLFFYEPDKIVYIHELAILRIIRIIRLIALFKLFGVLNKRLNIFVRNIVQIFLATLLVIFIGAIVLNQILDINIFEAIKWAFYVVFTGEIPEGLPDKTQKYLIGIFLILSNGILYAAIIGIVASYIMENYKNINFFDDFPKDGKLILIINYDKELVSSIIQEYIHNLYNSIALQKPINSSINSDKKLVLVSNLLSDNVNELLKILNNEIKGDYFLYFNSSFFIVNKNVWDKTLYIELQKNKDRIERIFILPDERESDEYHQDMLTSFIVSNIIRTLGPEFSKEKVIAITNTDIVNIDDVNIIKQHQVISKIINMEISFSVSPLVVSNFFYNVNCKIRQFKIQEFNNEQKLKFKNFLDFIEYIRRNYNVIVMGYIDKDGKYHMLINNLYSNNPKTQILESTNLNDIQSIICIE